MSWLSWILDTQSNIWVEIGMKIARWMKTVWLEDMKSCLGRIEEGKTARIASKNWDTQRVRLSVLLGSSGLVIKKDWIYIIKKEDK